ncbi:hypothetical protein HYX02_07950 [Candidatus Woesearchaeota archaeon]|nr:hypothetical protein [Candidatus Woesearchaeota archaeon]
MEAKDFVLLMLIPVILIGLVFYIDKNPVVTGAVSHTAAQQPTTSLGTYSISPSFRVKIDYGIDEYEEMKKQVQGMINECKQQQDMEKCLKEKSEAEWSCDKDKKAKPEDVLHDFVDKFNECLDLKENGIVCRFSFVERELSNRVFNIKLAVESITPDDRLVRAELVESNKALASAYLFQDNVYYVTIYDDPKLKLDKDSERKFANSAEIEVKFTGSKPEIKASGKSENQQTIEFTENAQNEVLLYKDKDGIAKFIDKAIKKSFLAEDPSKKTELPKIVDLPRIKGFVFCKESKYKTNAYDAVDNAVKPRTIMHKFAITFKTVAPKPIENLEAYDGLKAENSVVLVWDNPKEISVKSYNVYYSKENFIDKKIEDTRKEPNIYRKSVLMQPAEIDDIDLNDCAITQLNTPCKYAVYNNPLEKDKLYYWKSKDKLIYVLSDARLEDGKESNFAVTALNEAREELDNDKSISGNIYILTENRNYRKFIPVDDLVPSSKDLILVKLQQIYESASKKVTFNFGELPKNNVDGTQLNDFRNYKVYYKKYQSSTQQEKAEIVKFIADSKLNSLKLIQDVNYEKPGMPFFVDLTSTIPEKGNVYFFVIVASDTKDNPKEEQYSVNELGAVPLQLEIP